MAEFLFEIFCEEIPARMQERAGADLERLLTDGLKKAGLEVKDAHHWAGPRRLGFTCDVPVASPDISEERKGPRVGAPEQALAGFMRGAGLSDISEAETRSDKKGEFYVAKIEKPGRASSDIITDLVPAMMGNFPWPKSMKSGKSNFRWVRPLQSLICILGGDIIPVEVAGIIASNTTEGHRRHGRGPFMVKTFAAYKKTLESDGHVLLSADERKAKILKDAQTVCIKAGLELVEDAGLLAEVAGLAEWPVVILGDMDPSFLELPGEVIRLSMRNHQKYFAVRDPKTGNLAPNFVVVANQMAPDGGKAIAAGNSRVLSARLADAQFFQSEDAKKNLIDYYDKLGTVVFHKKLGSIKDKAERVAALAKELAPKVGANPDKAAQAAKLAKCDLVTQTVIEFTSLQGQIGRLMYEAEGGDADIAEAIEDHYRPQGPSDNVPTNPVAVAVALADKLDKLVGFWAIDEKPTGSKDPFALRRAALGVVRIILENKVSLNLHALLKNNSKTDGLFAFILDRLKVYLRDKGMRHDIIDAALAGGGDDLVSIVNRTNALQEFLETDAGENLLAGYKRAANILKAEAKKGDLPEGAPKAGSQAEEKALFTALNNIRPAIDKALESEDYAGAMGALASLRAPIDTFFDQVMVNSDDETERSNRLRLLIGLRDTAQRIADFDQIDG
jgi:glycyl-tRNA synthetase beta chain